MSPVAPKFHAEPTPAEVSPHALECVAQALNRAANNTETPARAAPRRSSELDRMSASVNGPLIIPESASELPSVAGAAAAGGGLVDGSSVADAVHRNGARLSALHLQDDGTHRNGQLRVCSTGAPTPLERKRMRRELHSLPAAAQPANSPPGGTAQADAAMANDAAAHLSPTGVVLKRVRASPLDRKSSDAASCDGSVGRASLSARASAGSAGSAEASGNNVHAARAVTAALRKPYALTAHPQSNCTSSQWVQRHAGGVEHSHMRQRAMPQRGTGHKWDRFRSQPRLDANMLSQLAAAMSASK